MRSTTLPPLRVLAAVTATVWVGGCSATESPTAATPPMQTATAVASPGVSSLTSAVLEVLESTIQDEFHAQAIYEAVLQDHGQVWPFVGIARAESRHAASLGQLYTRRGLEPPASRWNPGNVDRFGSVQEACAASVQAEIDNASLYDRALALELPRDVRNVFENNRAASLNNHLPAFRRCR